MTDYSPSRGRQARRHVRHVPRAWDRIVEGWAQRIRSGVEDYSISADQRQSHELDVRRERWSHGQESGIEITENVLSMHSLPTAFRGFRIVQLTDIHHGLYVPLQAVIDAVELSND